MLKKTILFAPLMILFLIPTAQADDFNCTSSVKTQINGSWFANFSSCSVEPKLNVTIVQNITTTYILNVTNTTFNESAIGLELADLRSNISETFKTNFDLIGQLQSLNNSLQLCIRDAQSTSNYSVVLDNLNTCGTEKSLLSIQIQDQTKKATQAENEKWYYLAGGLIASAVFFNRKKIFSGNNPITDRYDFGRKEGKSGHDVSEFQKKAREDQQRIENERLQAENESLKSEMEKKKKKG